MEVTARTLHEASMLERHEQWIALAGNRNQTSEEFKTSRNGYRKSRQPRSSATPSFKYENVTAVRLLWIGERKEQSPPSRTKANVWTATLAARIKAVRVVLWTVLNFQFIQSNQGLTTETNYPYKGVDNTCNTKKAASHAAKITGYEDVPANSEKALLKAVANQPVSVAIDASGSDFQFYSSGIFTGQCRTELDHGVTAVGYGTSDDGSKYWLVKNSWGTEWGEEGYIRMQRDVDAEEGLCDNIAMDASYPTASS
ncbi:hypothetical protein HHK36_005103 [Tetracentron sinense]|uniref:Peptidase C1A papain C-terminal domain-containing protein n=1 Tax=Tetracentron sinense TaxID=13715 RepID=A0A834ZKY2_TETSI|nr:hypothetical protein HHK36_005103 [Tetracentron sinense]